MGVWEVWTIRLSRKADVRRADRIFDTALHIGDREGPRLRLDLPTHAGVQIHRDRLSCVSDDRGSWTGGARGRHRSDERLPDSSRGSARSRVPVASGR